MLMLIRCRSIGGYVGVGKLRPCVTRSSIASVCEDGCDWCQILVVAYPLGLPNTHSQPIQLAQTWVIRIVAFPGSTHHSQPTLSTFLCLSGVYVSLSGPACQVLVQPQVSDPLFAVYQSACSAPQHAQYGLRVCFAWGCTPSQQLSVLISSVTSLEVYPGNLESPPCLELTSTVFFWFGCSLVK